MRCWLLLGAALLAGAGWAQTWYPGFERAFEQVVRQAPTAPRLPAPSDQASKAFKLIHADVSTVAGDKVSASGAVHYQYEGYDVWADAVEGDRRTQVFEMFGNVRVEGKTETITAESVAIDFKTRTLGFRTGRARLSPERLEGAASDDVYIRGASGVGDSSEFEALEGTFSTCELDQPHWEVDSRTTRVVPNKRVVLRDVRLRALGKTLIGLPYLVVPLVENGTKNLPEVGNSAQEGYFVKTRFSTPLPGESYFDTRVELMSRLGVGLGLELNYVAPRADGSATAYTILGPNRTFTATALHNQRLLGGNLALTTNLQRDDYLTAPSSTLWNLVGSFAFQPLGGSTRLNYSRTDGSTSGFRSVNQSGGVTDTRKLGTLSLNSEVVISKYETVSTGLPGVRSERLDTRFLARRDWRQATGELLYQRSLPIGRGVNFSSQSDRTPLLTVRSDSSRLWGSDFGRRWPIQMETSVGELSDALLNRPVTRLSLGTSLRKREEIGPSLGLDWGGRFLQGIYSDDTAQYVLAYDGQADWRFQRESSLRVRYSSLRSFGFTPLQIDRTGRTDSFDIELGYRPTPSLELSALTGYDNLLASRGEAPWQQVWLRADWRPSERFSLQGSAVYDTFSHLWSVVRLDSQFNLAGAKWAAGASYDGASRKVSAINLLVEGFRAGRVTANAIWDFNGFTNQVVAQHYQLVYDLHCAEMVFELIENNVGFNSGRTFSLYLRLKALPSSSFFGQGTRGQGVGRGRGGGF
ncbi:MAG: hypothetical protein AB7F50_06175 [Fimbriimonadaceae bacterium]